MAVFLAGFPVVVRLGQRFGNTSVRSLTIYIWHSIFSVVYAYFVVSYGGDAFAYYTKALAGVLSYKPGTSVIIMFTWVFAKLAGFSFLATSLVFNIPGSIGLLAFSGALKKTVSGAGPAVRAMAVLVVFLPSVSFWSAGIGKDSIAFMAVGLMVWGAQNTGRHAKLLAFAALVMLLVRPHIAGIMVLAILAAVIRDRDTSALRKVLFLSIILAAISYMLPLALNYATGAGDFSNVINTIKARQMSNLGGGSSVHIADMNLVQKLFTYFYRPHILEARSLTSLMAALDNTLLLLLSLSAAVAFMRSRRVQTVNNTLFLLVYSLATWVILASTTANLGIAIRQKWMFAPALLLVFLDLLAHRRERVAKPVVVEVS